MGASGNVGLGVGALDSITSGANNVAIGLNAGTATADGTQNTFVGQVVGILNVDGAANTAVGAGALAANVTGDNNTAFGVGALAANTNDFNAAFGYTALNSVTSGNRNAAFGTNTCHAVTTGTFNTCLGNDAMIGSVVTASNNTAVGYNSGPTSDISNTLSLGTGANPTVANTGVLGNSSVTDFYFGSTTAVAALNAARAILAPAVGATALTLTGNTQTSSFPVINATQTWNASGTTFTGIKFNATSTASAVGSLLMDLQTGGTSMGSIDKLGNLSLNASTQRFQIDTGTTNFHTVMSTAGTAIIDLNTTPEVQFGSTGRLSWSASTVGAGGDTFIKRGGAAATLQLGMDVNGAAVAQTLQAANGITGTDKTGSDFTLGSGNGTGAAAVSSVFISTPTVAASGTTAQTRTVRVTVNSSGLKATGYLSSDGTAGATTTCTIVGLTSITVKNGLITGCS